MDDIRKRRKEFVCAAITLLLLFVIVIWQGLMLHEYFGGANEFNMTILHVLLGSGFFFLVLTIFFVYRGWKIRGEL